jgi:serralysin
MPTTNDIEITPLSGLNHIDALLDAGPDWNYLDQGNVIYYTFSTTEGNETGDTSIRGAVQAFNEVQQINARFAFSKLAALTGIVFTEVLDGASAQIHLADVDIVSRNTLGLCSWQSSYTYKGSTLKTYSADAWVYLDNVEWRSTTSSLGPGSFGFEALLHELGHAMGLKHPFDDDIHLPAARDNTDYTLMSYTDGANGPHPDYAPYDVAALEWLYGGDGLAGALGINSVSGARYIDGSESRDVLVGTAANDTLRGNGGDDSIDGGDGTDTAVFNGARFSYALATAGAAITVSSTVGADGTDTLTNVELFQFTDGTFTREQLFNDNTAPLAPQQHIATNGAGYIAGNRPEVSGSTEAGATVKVYDGAALLGSTAAAADGSYRLVLGSLADGSYGLTATSTDANGNVSPLSTALAFKIDTLAPAAPNGTVSTTAGSNATSFAGHAEAGSTVSLVNAGNVVIGQGIAAADGSFRIDPHVLANGAYNIAVRASDAAGNSSNAAATLAFSIDSALNLTGTSADDRLAATAGNNAIDGGAGTDTALYTGARANYTVQRDLAGFGVHAASGADGNDMLYNVERIHFADISVALDDKGSAGQAYRMYSAFGRTADLEGLGFWINVLDRGYSLEYVASNFISSPEFAVRFGPTVTTADFVETLYTNVLHRHSDIDGFNFWVNCIDNAGVSRAYVFSHFTDSPENEAQLIGQIVNGMDYIPYG